MCLVVRVRSQRGTPCFRAHMIPSRSASGMCRPLILRLRRNEDGWIDNSVTGITQAIFNIFYAILFK